MILEQSRHEGVECWKQASVRASERAIIFSSTGMKPAENGNSADNLKLVHLTIFIRLWYLRHPASRALTPPPHISPPSRDPPSSKRP
jgi:hypothetical protein